MNQNEKIPEFMTTPSLDREEPKTLPIECCGIPSSIVKIGNWEDGELIKTVIAKQYVDYEKSKIGKCVGVLTHLWWIEYDLKPEHRCDIAVKRIEEVLMDVTGELPGKSLQ